MALNLIFVLLISTKLFLFCLQGYDMSTFIRRYARYLNEKAYAYRAMAFDFTRVKKGYVDGF